MPNSLLVSSLFKSTQIPAPVHQLTVNHLPVSGQGAVASIDAVLRQQSGYELSAKRSESFCAFMHKAVQLTCRLIVSWHIHCTGQGQYNDHDKVQNVLKAAF